METEDIDWRNGHRSFRESDELMQKLLSYREVPDYHPADQPLPYMVPIPKWVKPHKGVAIFPGGNGLSLDAVRFPRYGVLILAHDFDSLQSYERAVDRGYTPAEDAAFETLLRKFRTVTDGKFDQRVCFFTNRFMGVRKVKLNEDGKEPKNSQNGTNPSRKHALYRKMCLEMLDATLEKVQPLLIITLGEPAATTLDLGREYWETRGVHDVVVRKHATKLVCLTHTGIAKGLYDTNVAKVAYTDVRGVKYQGVSAEDALMRDAWNEYMRAADRIGLPEGDSASLSSTA